MMKSGSIYGTAIFQTRQAIRPHSKGTTMNLVIEAAHSCDESRESKRL
jgi:hypothetical protein